MENLYFLVIVCLFIVRSTTDEISSDSVCGGVKAPKSTVNLFLNARKDESGEWTTTYQAWKSNRNKTTQNDLTMDLKQTVYDCEDGETVHVTGTIRANKIADSSGKMKFYPVCGKNAAIINNGRTAVKLNLDESLNGALFTDRPLRRNELFEVRLDKKHTKFNYAIGIGVTTLDPNSSPIPDLMWHLKSGSWMYYHMKSHHDGQVLILNYGKNIDELKVGDRVGVMVTEFNTLHYFVNGVDQGPAASNIPATVRGAFELYANAAQGTIVS